MARLRREYNETPLTGYVQILPVVEAYGGDAPSAIKRMRMLGFTPRKFRRLEDRQYAWYALPEAIEAWEAWYKSQPNSKGFEWKPSQCRGCGQTYQPAPGGQIGRFCTKLCQSRYYHRNRRNHGETKKI